MTWKCTINNPCKICYGWNPVISSSCTHDKYNCPECGRKQCLLHWLYPMGTKE